MRSLAALLVALAAAFWSLGLVRFLRAEGVVEYRRRADGPAAAGVHNLAALSRGPTVRASSVFRSPGAQHHPAFLVDGVASPALIEKWTSLPGDRQPWVEVRWRQPRRLHRVVLHHAGLREDAALTVKRYRLTCLGGAGNARAVTDNVEAIAAHALPCLGAHGVRLDFAPNGPDQLVRLYEIEAWGE